MVAPTAEMYNHNIFGRKSSFIGISIPMNLGFKNLTLAIALQQKFVGRFVQVEQLKVANFISILIIAQKKEYVNPNYQKICNFVKNNYFLISINTPP